MAQKSSDTVVRDDTGLTVSNTNMETVEDRSTSENLEFSSEEGQAETQTIKAQIEETRADMGETIDAIQEKLSLSNISEQVSEQVNNAIETAKDTVYEATVGKAAHFMKNTGKQISNSSIVTAAKENPLPFILIGLGAGLLAYQGFGSKNNRSAKRYRRPDYLAEERQTKKGSLMQSAQDNVRSVKDTVSGAAGSAYEGVTKAAENTYSSAGDLAHRAMEKASDLGTKAQETYDHLLEERPWAIGVAALAAGAAIGMAIPSTRYEGELMGEARINLMNKVQDTATTYIDKAKQAASEAGQTVIDEAKTLTEEKLA